MKVILSAVLLAFAISTSGASAQQPEPKEKGVQTQKKQQKVPGKDEQAPGKGAPAPGKEPKTPGKGTQEPGKGPKTPGKGAQAPGQGNIKTWKNGEKLPAPHNYQDVNDFRMHGLKPPAKGQRWVRVNGQYLLIVTATGAILSVIAGQ